MRSVSSRVGRKKLRDTEYTTQGGGIYKGRMGYSIFHFGKTLSRELENESLALRNHPFPKKHSDNIMNDIDHLQLHPKALFPYYNFQSLIYWMLTSCHFEGH